MPLTDFTPLEFRRAVAQLSSTSWRDNYGELFVDPENRKVIDESNNNRDVTPNEQEITDALIEADAVQVLREQHETRRAGAKTEFNNVPQYARMTGQEMSDWIDSNVSDLASAKTVLKAMARMIAALRNEIYPDLEGSD